MQHRLITFKSAEDKKDKAIDARLSFKPFLDYVRKRLEDKDAIKKEIYELILEKFAKYPELDGVINVEDTGRYKELLNLLYIVLSTVVEDEKKVLWGISVPVTPQLFFGSDALYEFLTEADSQELREELQDDKESQMHRQKCEMLYSFLLDKFYDFNFNQRNAIIKPLFDRQTGLLRYYRINIDTRFVEVTTNDQLPELNLENLQVHLHEESGIDVLERILPFKLFSFTGFSILTITDVTEDQAMEKMRDLLVNSHGKANEENHEAINQSLKALAGSKDVEFSLLPIFRINNKIVQDYDAYSHSILFSVGKQDGVMKDFFLPLIEKFVSNPRIVYFRDLEQSPPAQLQVGKLFQLSGVKSYSLLPVIYNGNVIGAFEMYSRVKDALNEQVFARIDAATTLVAQLIQNSIDDFNTRINETIREKFTSLQPSVQWKFNEAAWDYIYQSRMDGKPSAIRKIEFRQVYPLYGAIDMRNSTIERNRAVLSDLQYQFDLLHSVLQQLKERVGFALTDDFIFKCRKWRRLLDDILTTHDEIRINQFVNDEAHPFLKHFQQSHPELQPVINDYFAQTDPATGQAWLNRRQLEESMQLINGAVNNYLDLMNVEIQQAYPSYFEKFRTDGVEYDIYIGQSIAPDRPFDSVYLKNLRLWQLGSMAAIARLSKMLIPRMQVPLETTQLIFIYSNPIDISFRNDERRFDVEGGYNIRYHILKKRIDKVHIRNSRERLTQPGKIALVYFDQKDADEYISYIQHLQEKNILNDDLEFLELEELQGVSGLRAIRVGIVTEDRSLQV